MYRHHALIPVLALLASTATAQPAEANPLTGPRMRAIAMQSVPPGPLTKPYIELLDNVAAAIDHSTLDVAADRFESFLVRQRDAGRKAVPNGYIDYILRTIAIAASEDAARAAERVAYFTAQEGAVLEHLSLLEKEHSYRIGSRLPDFILREPVLGVFGTDPEPIQQGLPRPVNTEQLPELIATWRQSLDKITEDRAAAVTAFTGAVRADPELTAKLANAERILAQTVKKIFDASD